MVSFPFNHCSRLCIAILELTKIIQFGSMDFRVVNGDQWYSKGCIRCITLCFKDAEMIWAWPHISIVKISALKVHSNTLFYHVQTISGRLADDHKLSRNRLPGGRGCLDFFKPRALTGWSMLCLAWGLGTVYWIISTSLISNFWWNVLKHICS